jgi:hypothetical protein
MSADRERRSRLIDFERVGRAALARSDQVVRSFLPDGKLEGREWTAPNPFMPQRRRTSRAFRVNVYTGAWADFGLDVRGRDLVSLVAYVANLSQRDAAIRLAESLGVDPFA